ncbi:MAG TPA: AI-2E family transporter [Polyangia bacterium]|nr:AI-2E family transporter [Polyangia bacterium]
MSTLWQSVRRLWALWGFAAFCVVVVILFHQVVLPFILALLLAYVLEPVVTRLSRVKVRGFTLSRGVGVIICYLGIVGVLGIFFGAFLPRLSGDFARLFREAPQFFTKVKADYVPRLSSWIEAHFPADEEDARIEGPRPERKLTVSRVSEGRYEVSLENVDLQVETTGKGRWVIGPHREGEGPGRLEDLIERLASAGQSEAMELLKLGQRFVSGVVAVLAKLILVLMLTAFILIDIERLHSFLRGLVPPVYNKDFDEVWQEMDRGLSGVIRGQLLICLVNGMLTYIGLLIFSVKYSLLLGMLAGGMSLIPVFGSILSSIPIVAIALVSGGGGVTITRGLLVLGWILLIHLIEANFLNPKIIGGSAKIHPVLVVFALLAGEHTGGLVGALLAVPIASMVQTLFVYFRRRTDTPTLEVA